MTKGDRVMIHPHGSPDQKVEAIVDLVSGNGKSIALRLQSYPKWARTPDGGMILHREDLKPEMLLLRLDVGPWIEAFNEGHYEIEPVRPA